MRKILVVALTLGVSTMGLASCMNLGKQGVSSIMSALSGEVVEMSEIPLEQANYGEGIVSERPVGRVSGLKVSSAMKVEIYYADIPRLVITSPSAERAANLIVEERGGTLTIEEKKLPRKLDKVGVHRIQLYIPELKELKGSGAVGITIGDDFDASKLSVDLSGASMLSAEGLKVRDRLSVELSGASRTTLRGLRSGKLTLDLSGASHVNVSGSASDLEVEASGASHVALTELNSNKTSFDCSGASSVVASGSASKVEIELTGASKLDALELKCNSARIDLAGSSHATLSVRDKITYELSGASSLRYKGSPSLSGQVGGSSSIRSL